MSVKHSSFTRPPSSPTSQETLDARDHRCPTCANPTVLASASFAQIMVVKDRSTPASHMNQQALKTAEYMNYC